MALPKLNVPKYKVKLPSDGKTIVNFRPFLVKEEKLLLVATETGDQEQLLDTIKGILKECTDIVDVEKLATFDIEYLFLNIRGKSVGEQIEVMVTCPDDNKTQVPMSINVDTIKVQKDENHSPDIVLDDVYTLRRKYPS